MAFYHGFKHLPARGVVPYCPAFRQQPFSRLITVFDVQTISNPSKRDIVKLPTPHLMHMQRLLIVSVPMMVKQLPRHVEIHEQGMWRWPYSFRTVLYFGLFDNRHGHGMTEDVGGCEEGGGLGGLDLNH